MVSSPNPSIIDDDIFNLKHICFERKFPTQVLLPKTNTKERYSKMKQWQHTTIINTMQW